jgi:hypothetical protein
MLRGFLAAHALLRIQVQQVVKERFGTRGEVQVVDGGIGLAASDVSEQPVFLRRSAFSDGVPIRERGFTRE